MTATSFRPEVLSLDPVRLHGVRCRTCEQVSFPVRESCPACGAPDALEPHLLTTAGRLCSWTVVRNAPSALRTPYTLAYVDLPEDGVRILTRLCDVEDEELVVGLPLELVALPVSETLAEPPASDGTRSSEHLFAFRPSLEEDR